MGDQFTAMFIFGTRPEAIKMAPVVRAFQADPQFRTLVCVTGQHRAMLDQVMEFFEIKADFDLNLMQPNQSLSALAARAIQRSGEIIAETKPDLVLVQGDTTTAFAGAFAAFQSRVPVAHIEAGLRSHQKLSPFPEEMNRLLVGQLADLHFPPLEGSRQNLEREHITRDVHVVGNTVVDALLQGLSLIRSRGEEELAADFPQVRWDRPLLLVTIHRRESFGQPIVEVFEALRELAANPGLEIVYPVHLNPNVHEVAHRILGGLPNVHLIPPLGYAHFIWMMSKATLILTDSGGVQEEAPSLGVPVLVAREVTERAEGVTSGHAKLVGTDRALIVSEARAVLEGRATQPEAANPYGDGQASQRILDISRQFLQAR